MSWEDIEAIKWNRIDTMRAQQNAIVSHLYWSQDRIDAWSTGGYLAKICERTIEWYVKFIQHLIVLATTVSWDEANREREHFIREIGMLRSNASNRVRLLCEIYIYLRESNENRWRSEKLESQRVLNLLSTQLPTPCRKCGLLIHGTAPCAWERLTDEEARKMGRQLMMKWANGDTGGGDNNRGKGKKGKKDGEE